MEQTASQGTIVPFDNYEINPCRRYESDKPGHHYFEVCKPEEADVWTLYGHIPGEGVEAIADCQTEQQAEQVYQRITGRPFGSHKENEARIRLMHAAPELRAACETALQRLLWVRELAGKAAELLTDNPAAQELLDEITSSEYAADDMNAICLTVAEVQAA